MQVKEGARRMGVVANWMLTLSLCLLVFWWKVSAALFVLAWALYGTGYILDGFSRQNAMPAAAQLER